MFSISHLRGGFGVTRCCLGWSARGRGGRQLQTQQGLSKGAKMPQALDNDVQEAVVLACVCV
jgi:hypothetical protein